MQARIKAVGRELYGEFQPMGPHNHQSTTCTGAKTYMHTWKKPKNCRESSHYIYKERFHMIIVIGKWTSF